MTERQVLAVCVNSEDVDIKLIPWYQWVESDIEDENERALKLDGLGFESLHEAVMHVRDHHVEVADSFVGFIF